MNNFQIDMAVKNNENDFISWGVLDNGPLN
jgi:hypothetical protein